MKAELVSSAQIHEMFTRVDAGELAKEALPQVFSWLSQYEGKTVGDSLENLGLRFLSKEALLEIVEKAVEENRELIETRGGEAFGRLMGLVMKEVRGKANPKLVSELIKARLEKSRKRD